MTLIESGFDDSPVALIVSNSKHKIITANKKAKSILFQGELVGRNLLDIFDYDSRLKVHCHESGKDKAIQVRLYKVTPERWFELSYQTLSKDPEFVVWGINDITIYKLREKKLENLAYYDFLTGAYTRHYFFYLSEIEMNQFHRSQKIFSVLLLDIDDFKLVNDTYGHSTGDKVLQELALLISKRLRNEDIFGRIGGEEFAIVLSNTSHDEAVYIATRLCQAVEEHFKYCAVTVSVGVASVHKNVKKFKQLLNNADEALYCRKRNGKNGVQANITQ